MVDGYGTQQNILVPFNARHHTDRASPKGVSKLGFVTHTQDGDEYGELLF
jgi:hypothetical protein